MGRQIGKELLPHENLTQSISFYVKDNFDNPKINEMKWSLQELTCCFVAAAYWFGPMANFIRVVIQVLICQEGQLTLLLAWSESF